MKKSIILILLCFMIMGCAALQQTGRIFWGTSIAHLEKARDEAITKDFQCSFSECFEAVLSLAENEKDLEPLTEKTFNVFQKNPRRNVIVFMDIPDAVDTTEVGVFIMPKDSKTMKIDISSLSVRAKESVAKAVFKELDMRFAN